MTTIIGRNYESKLEELRVAVLSGEDSIETRVMLDQEVKGSGRCYYCPNGPSLDWLEVSKNLLNGVERYFFHTNCFLDLLNKQK